jgi:hypothetical protein
MLNLLLANSTYFAANLSPTLAEMNKWNSSMAWFLVLFCVVLGMLATLQPVKREKEVKGRRE